MSDLFFFRDDELIHRAREKPWKAVKAAKFIDSFEMQYSNTEPEYLRDDELPALVGSVLVYDTECFENFFFIAFRHVESGKVISLEQDESTPLNAGKLDWLMRNFCIIGYNSNTYDILLLELACTGVSCKRLFEASCDIILRDIRPHDFEKKYKIKRRILNHIDLIEVAPLRGSLKLYAGRLHTKRMQDLPVDPLKPLSPQDRLKVVLYCFNDLLSTELLFRELESQLQLRNEMSVQYHVDLRSKSDAQIAEAVIKSELEKLNGFRIERPNVDPHREYMYMVPHFISYRTPILQNMLAIVRSAHFALDQWGYIIMPREIEELQIPLGQCIYKMGIGGLHSTEKVMAHVADEDTLLIDRDVVSYYPSIIINQRLCPKHLGSSWLTVYKSIVDRRIEAKDAGDKITAASLKITINGSFGKLGSKYSVLYAPDLMIQVTLTGQLSLLMLIDMIEDLGIPVVSANTDGLIVKCPKTRAGELQERVSWWERLTGFKTEETRYKAIYSRDVNNYIALKEEGKCKVKGTYAERGSAGDSVLSKNPESLICADAVLALIEKGTPIEQTIRTCKDIKRFVTIRNVTGGARKSDVYLGKVIRWYYSTAMKGEINRATKGDKIPKTDRARPLMELPAEFPKDIDFDRYIEAATEMLHNIGYLSGPYKANSGYLGPLFDDSSNEA